MDITRWTHIRVSRETQERLKLLSYATGVPVSTIVSIFAEEGVLAFEADWDRENSDGRASDRVRSDTER